MNLQRMLAELENCPDDCADELAAGIVNRLSEWATINGHSALVREWTPAASRVEVRRYLADAIAATRTPPDDELLTLDQAADVLGYSVSGLRKIVRKRGIQFAQVGKGPIKFKRKWLDDFAIANSNIPNKARPRVEPIHLKHPG